MPPLPPAPPRNALGLTHDAGLAAKVVALEARIAALEQIICATSGGVSIVTPGNLAITCGGDLTVTAGKSLLTRSGLATTLDTGTGFAINARKDASLRVSAGLTIESATSMVLKTGPASVALNAGGDVLIQGTKITAKSSGDVVLKGSKILQN
jgi:type VI secretion system secreted protein VgrG